MLLRLESSTLITFGNGPRQGLNACSSAPKSMAAAERAQFASTVNLNV